MATETAVLDAEVVPLVDDTSATDAISLDTGKSPSPAFEMPVENANGPELETKDSGEVGEADSQPNSDVLVAETEKHTVEQTDGQTHTEPAVTKATSGQGQSQGQPKTKSKKKEDKSIDHILRALSGLTTTEEKLAALCKKYTDLLDDHRILQAKFKQNQRSHNTIMREKEQLHAEHGKAVLAKSKLESLCRELQRHNKLIKEESLARAREEEEKRKEVTNRFQSTINDIQQQMTDNHAKNTKLREENLDLSAKLKSLIEQYEAREEHIQKLFAHKELEQQLVDAKLQQATLQMTEEKEKHIMEKQQILTDAAEARQKIQLMEAQEKQLRAQVALYTEKYEEFQQTLQKSNEVFQSFKSEMDKMTKKIKKLEKDTSMWRSRWESSNKALIDMAEEKTKNEKEITTLLSKVQRLESLCRALQAERKKSSPDAKGDLAAALQSSTEKVKSTDDIQVTKTPPNTPDQSRASPVTVQLEEANSKNSSHELDAPLTMADGDQEPAVSPVEENKVSEEKAQTETMDTVVTMEKQDGHPEQNSAQPDDVTPENDIEAVD